MLQRIESGDFAGVSRSIEVLADMTDYNEVEPPIDYTEVMKTKCFVGASALIVPMPTCRKTMRRLIGW
jgi:hypothetical protein